MSGYEHLDRPTLKHLEMSQSVEKVIVQSRVLFLKRSIDDALDHGDKAAFLRYSEELLALRGGDFCEEGGGAATSGK